MIWFWHYCHFLQYVQFVGFWWTTGSGWMKKEKQQDKSWSFVFLCIKNNIPEEFLLQFFQSQTFFLGIFWWNATMHPHTNTKHKTMLWYIILSTIWQEKHPFTSQTDCTQCKKLSEWCIFSTLLVRVREGTLCSVHYVVNMDFLLVMSNFPYTLLLLWYQHSSNPNF